MVPRLIGTVLLSTLALGLPAQERAARTAPADARFMCYFDLQALLDVVGRDLVQSAVTQHVRHDGGFRLSGDWNVRLEREWGFDPLRDLQGVLLFGDEAPHDGGSIVVITSDRIDTALGKLRDMGALAEEERDGVRVEGLVPQRVMAALGIGDAGDDEQEPAGFVHVQKLRGQRALVFGERADEVGAAASALRGEHALELGGSGCIARLEVRGGLEDLVGDGGRSRVSGKVEHLAMQLDRRDGEIRFTASADTNTEKDARQIAAIVNGLKGLLSLADPHDEMPEALVDALVDTQAEADGKSVRLRFVLPDSILAELRSHVQRELGGHGDEHGDEDEAPPRPKPKSRRQVR